MARYKTIDTSPRFLAVDLERQLLPGTFEHAIHRLLDHEIDLSALDARYCNDATGATAYPPATLLKLVLFAYSQGIVSSRAIQRMCRDHVIFIALSGDSQPHFTTIAGFIRTLGEEIAQIFAQVLLICDRQGLIGREMFAIDGVKLPSNASKQRSGTRADFQRQASKLEAAAKKMLERHRSEDEGALEPDLDTKERQRVDRLQRDAAELRQWLADHPQDRLGPRGSVRKSNRTDNESAKMATSKGVIQGYCGVAAVDDKHQIIIEAQAHGTGSEQELLLPIVDALVPHMDAQTLLTADAGYHSEANLKALDERGIDALIADTAMRKRDERFADQARYKDAPDPLYDKRGQKPDARDVYTTRDFIVAADQSHCTCPAGKTLYRNGKNCTIRGYSAVKFRGALKDCGFCPLRIHCLRKPETTQTRQVAILTRKTDKPSSYTERMRKRIDSQRGRQQYAGRFATVEPVFGNLRFNKQLNRLTVRGRRKVDTQWKLYCLVHNIEKLAKNGYAR
jgi:transposase